MEAPEVVSVAAANPEAMKVLDANPAAQTSAVMVEGRINGEPARGIALLIFGSMDGPPTETSVHAFTAPSDVFVALGGFAVPAVKWLGASTAPDEDMTEDGSLPPDVATRRLADFFAAWIEHYVVPMMAMSMQIQMQSIQNMQSWNNAMSACGGDPSCTVAPTTDGSGDWTAVQQ